MQFTPETKPEPTSIYAHRQLRAERLADNMATEVYQILGITLDATLLLCDFRARLLQLAAISRDK
jgi:hypothetical protein